MPEKLCIVCGKIPTNHPSGTCVMCMINGTLPPQASRRELQNEKPKKKEEVMPVTEENKGRKCSVEGCFKFAVKGGMCLRDFNEAHGIEKRRGRKPTGEDKDKPECSVEGCGDAAKAKGLCNKHYMRKLKEKGRIGKNKRGRGRGAGSRVLGNNPVPAGSSPAPATKTNGSLVSIDLSNFPKTYKFISALPEIPPEDILEVLLKQRLNELEERIAI